ncbi:hypothetical protein EDB86DRAFT_2835737 [Lactarius hatsudake]|nr:hypothetical protein EDB86DRAFT_2835737 [Lactarius hatsudake]
MFRKGQTSVDGVPHRRQTVSARSGTAPATAKPIQNSQSPLKASILILLSYTVRTGVSHTAPPHFVSAPLCNIIPPTALPCSAAAQASRPRSLPATSYTACRSAARACCMMASIDVDVCTCLATYKQASPLLPNLQVLRIPHLRTAPDTEGAKAEAGPLL